jgi:4-hydroxy-tetrahydrodipicolinate synthase/2-keto-3-deoxy-L-arabinonate dehydratase
MSPSAKPRYKGVFPVVPTTFDDRGALDLDSQKRCVDFMIDAGSDGLCILANFSEQFALADDERELLTAAILGHVAGRVPVIVTTTHFSSRVCAERSRRAQDAGAAMVMVMPPYHGATIRAPEAGILDFFRTVSDAVDIPIMVQDAPVSGTALPAALLARMAREVRNVAYFKVEVPGAAAKLRELVALGGEAVEGPWDGEEGITLLADLDAGATGSMTGGAYPDGLRPIVDAHLAGRREEAVAGYERWLPLINYENRQCGPLAAKALMKEGGVIASEAPRHPFAPLHPATRAGLVETARRLDPLVLRWAR